MSTKPTKGGILKSDESCISNPEIRNLRIGLNVLRSKPVRFEISGFEMQDSSDFKIPPSGVVFHRQLSPTFGVYALSNMLKASLHPTLSLTSALRNSQRGSG